MPASSFDSTQIAQLYWASCVRLASANRKSKGSLHKLVATYTNPDQKVAALSGDHKLQLRALIFCHAALEAIQFEVAHQPHSGNLTPPASRSAGQPPDYKAGIPAPTPNSTCFNEPAKPACVQDVEERFRRVVGMIDHLTLHAARSYERHSFRKTLNKFSKDLFADAGPSLPLEMGACAEADWILMEQQKTKQTNAGKYADKFRHCLPYVASYVRQLHLHRLTKKDFPALEAEALEVFREELFRVLKLRANELKPHVLAIYNSHLMTDSISILNASMAALNTKLNELAKTGNSPLGPVLTVERVEVGDVTTPRGHPVLLEHVSLRCDVTHVFKTQCFKNAAKDFLKAVPGGCNSEKKVSTIAAELKDGQIKHLRNEIAKRKKVKANVAKLEKDLESCRNLTTAVSPGMEITYRCENNLGEPRNAAGKSFGDGKQNLTTEKPTADKPLKLICQRT